MFHRLVIELEGFCCLSLELNKGNELPTILFYEHYHCKYEKYTRLSRLHYTYSHLRRGVRVALVLSPQPPHFIPHRHRRLIRHSDCCS